MLRRLALALAITAALPASRASAAPPSSAATASPALVVIADAPVSKQAVAGLGAKLPEPWHLGDDAAFRKRLAAQGQRTPAGIALGNAAARASLAVKAQAAARDAGAGAVLFVRVTPKRRGRLVTLLLVAPGNATPLVDTTVEAPVSDDGAALIPSLAPALTSLARPAPAEPPPPAAPPAAAPPASPAGADSPSPDKPAPTSLGGADKAILVFSAGGGSGARIFRYHDGLSPLLRAYDLPASPNIVVAAEVYPLARLSVPVVRGLGLYGGFQRALGVSSETSSGMKVSTSWWRAEGGLRLRLAFGDDGRVIVGAHGGIVKERFGYEGDKALVPWLPDVDYLFWRAGVDGRVRLGPIGLLAQFAYLPAFKSGDLADRFRQTTFGAVELGGGLAVPVPMGGDPPYPPARPVVRVFEMRATAVYTRVFYSFHPEVGDLYVAGGALDHLVRAQLLATLLL